MPDCHNIRLSLYQQQTIRILPSLLSLKIVLRFSIIKGSALVRGDVGRHATLLGAKGVWSIFHLLLLVRPAGRRGIAMEREMEWREREIWWTWWWRIWWLMQTPWRRSVKYQIKNSSLASRCMLHGYRVTTAGFTIRKLYAVLLYKCVHVWNIEISREISGLCKNSTTSP